MGDVAALRRRIEVAAGRRPADLVLAGGRVVNVFTGAVERADVTVAGDHVVAVDETPRDAVERLDVSGAVVAPGLIDAHMHIESTLLTPAELARLVVPRGTSTVIADPHEIGNVLGATGIELMLALSTGLPLDCLFMVPSCVPASPFEASGATLDADAVAPLLRHRRVLGLAEMMDFPGVLAADETVLTKIARCAEAGGIVDGHAPGLMGPALQAYAAAGIRSDHECTTAEEALARARLGMLVQVREGSMARNLDAMLPLMAAGRLGSWCLCTDDVHPGDLVAHGHLDGLLARAVAGGVDPAEAVRHATLVPARHYGLDDRGAVAPGGRADLVVFEDLTTFTARLVVKDGRVVARGGVCADFTVPTVQGGASAFTVDQLEAARLEVPAGGAPVPVIRVVPDQIVTEREDRVVASRAGRWIFDANDDVALITCCERHRGTGRLGVGLVSGFGFRRHGALASSVGHDAHNLLITGTNAEDMVACGRAVAEAGGGFAVVRDGVVTALMPLPIAGLLSLEPAAVVCRQQAEVDEAARGLGCSLASPFGTLSFMALTVIPELRITDRGLFDVEAFALVDAEPAPG